jgi:8-oxo-dGTP pyrophosphatase MutT (NUDIX family)
MTPDPGLPAIPASRDRGLPRPGRSATDGPRPHRADGRPSAGGPHVTRGTRHTEPIDVHLLLRRGGDRGPEVLLSRRAGDVYAAGLWHAPSGHLDGPHEDIAAALVREAHEETGVVIDLADVHFALTVHHRGPGGRSRIGVFFEVRAWRGVPEVREPAVCDAMGWFGLDALPEPMVAYCRAGLDAYRTGARLALHFQQPGDPIAYDPATDRLRLVPHTSET